MQMNLSTDVVKYSKIILMNNIVVPKIFRANLSLSIYKDYMF